MNNLFVDARTTLLEGLIDYAGLFPPASLDMPNAVSGYRAAREGATSWILGRFLCPSSRLVDLAEALIGSMTQGEPSWPISVIFDEGVAAGAVSARVFNSEMKPAASIVLAEARLPADAVDEAGVAVITAVGEIVTAVRAIGPSTTPFLEVPMTEHWSEAVPAAVAAIARAAHEAGVTAGAKLRCGGVTRDAFPTEQQVARFVRTCVDHNLALKATAGLHHPIRHFDEELGVMRHGFLNVLAAVAMAESAGATEATIAAIVAEEDPSAFRIGRSGLYWRKLHAGTAAVKRLRTELFPSYGSCSFDEPVADLTDLGLLPDTSNK